MLCTSVELQIFSGTPNPILHLNTTTAQLLCALIPDAPAPLPSCRVMGFTGWKLGDGSVWRGIDAFDRMLLEHPSFKELQRPVREHVLNVIQGPSVPCHAVRADGEVPQATDSEACSDVPIRGPDDPSKVHYAPPSDDDGCFKKRQDENNCYDYGSDIVTNSFAQPGRGSGVCPKSQRPCVKNTCDAVRKAAESDGLRWVGTALPKQLPPAGHYVSLHIWPDQNFHWLRMDADMMWSHKPGGSRVRNVDNDGKLISDPAKADVSPWSQHCGYMHVLPSNVTIF